MSDELMNRARGLLALRDKATPGPWHANGIAIEGAMDISEWETPTFSRYENTEFASAAHDMADTIRDLLAEVERLANNADNSALEAADMRARAEAAEQREAVLSAAEVKIDGHRFACSQAVADHVARLDADRVAAESRLCELASAEPVGYCTEGMGIISRKAFGDFMIPLIRRPEMK